MAAVEVTGFGENDELQKWINRLAMTTKQADVLDNLGKMGVTDSVKFIADNKVKPETSEETFAARRKRKKPGGSPRTLWDTGIGAKQISHSVDSSAMTVSIGVPDGYMAYQQEGRVPRGGDKKKGFLPKREFLQLPSESDIEKTIQFFLEK